jgi:hypothetical protein
VSALNDEPLFVVYLPDLKRWAAKAGRVVDSPIRARLFSVRAWAEKLADGLVRGTTKLRERRKAEDGTPTELVELVRYTGQVEIQHMDAAFTLLHADRLGELPFPTRTGGAS